MRAVRSVDRAAAVADVSRPAGEGVRVAIRSAGICGSDLHLLTSDFPLPFVLGHEMAGELSDGTAVAIEPLVPCGHCDRCQLGEYNLCRSGMSMLLGVGRDGGMCEEIVVPERCLVPLARGVSVQDACLVEPLAVAIHGLRQAGITGGMRVAMIGGGTIGLCAVAAAVAAEAEVGLEARHESQRAAGERLGARTVAGEYDLVVDCAGTPSALERAVDLCRPGGTLLLLGTYWDGMSLPGIALCIKELRILPSSLYARAGVGRDVDLAAALLATRPEIPRALITHRFPLDAASEAFETARGRATGAIKVVLEP
jgi:threonine dehydrogenase-like Zn-dependent dehydrogenase